MKGSETRLTQLLRLLQSGAVARSVVSRDLFAAIVPALDSGVLAEERSVAGRRIVVRDVAAFHDFIRHHFPSATLPQDASSRVSGVARFRNTKALASDLSEIVMVRAWHDDVLRCEGKPIAAAAATQAHGIFSFLLHDPVRFSLHGPCALVENPALLIKFERLQLPPSLALYGHGRSSNRLLDWLAGQTAPGFHLLHLPDYDPVGLDEFTRLRQRLGPRVQLHLPGHLAELFACHANNTLLQKPSTQSLLAKLRLSDLHEVRAVLTLIEKHNAGLEQEALLIQNPEPHLRPL